MSLSSVAIHVYGYPDVKSPPILVVSLLHELMVSIWYFILLTIIVTAYVYI